MQTFKLITSCHRCNRQYVVTNRKVGEQFQCACGQLLKVPRPKVHEANVVRCSSCGGVRENNANRCGFCGSDFTLHERDLHTVCPTCMTRISDHAKYCHYCATPITAQSSTTPGNETEHACPICDDKTLRSRAIKHTKLNALDCQQCGGIWLGHRTFELLEEKMQLKAVSGITRNHKANVLKPQFPLQEAGEKFYRACPICEVLMHRQNYGPRSGVIVDVCAKHGLWFDMQELAAILRWIKTGGLLSAKLAEIRRLQAEKRRLESKEQLKTVNNTTDIHTLGGIALFDLLS